MAKEFLDILPSHTNTIELVKSRADKNSGVATRNDFYKMPSYKDIPSAEVNVPVSKVKVNDFSNMINRLSDEITTIEGEISKLQISLNDIRKTQDKSEEFFQIQKELGRYNKVEHEQFEDKKKLNQLYQKMIEEKEDLIKIKKMAREAIQIEKNNYIKECAEKYYYELKATINDKLDVVMSDYLIVLSKIVDLVGLIKGMEKVYSSVDYGTKIIDTQHLATPIYSVLNHWFDLATKGFTSGHAKIYTENQIKDNAKIAIQPK